MCSDVAIRARGLGKTYALYERPLDRLLQGLWRGRREYGRRFAALTDVSFELPRGSVLGLVGRNGAGKSTLLQLICGTVAPSSGTIEVNGRVAALLELGAGFNPEFTGRENVFFNAAVLGLPETEIHARFDAIAGFADIGEFIDLPVKTYSSGMYVRLAFSIATSIDPDILVIDEALSVGDGAFARKSFDRIMALKDKGATILFCSHSMYHIEAICDRALWLEQGRTRMEDTAARVAAGYQASLNAGMADTPSSMLPPAARNAPLPSGTGRILRITASVDGITHGTLVARSGASSLAVEVEFSIDPLLPPPTLAVGFSDSNILTIASALSHSERVSFPTNADGIGKGTVVFPNLPLLKGDYWISAFILCDRGLHIYDAAERAVSFKVVQTGPEQGLVALPHQWLA